MTKLAYAIAGVCLAINTYWVITEIGKPRKPVTNMDAAANAVLNLAILVTLIFIYK